MSTTGLDSLSNGAAQAALADLRGRRIGLLCNHTAIDSAGRHAATVLGDIPGVDLVRLLGPEHGVWGTHQDMESVPTDADSIDGVFGLPTVSLYGGDVDSLVPNDAALEGLDAVVCDIQDIGSRYYTYAATIALTMERCADKSIPVWVLDRPNPLGPDVEGPLVQPGFESFCGLEAGLPIRHGLSSGALARWYQQRRAPGCALNIVYGRGNRSPIWLPPSPNMPTRDTAWVYPGMCMLEGTTLSEGRGTTSPFQLVGAPGIDVRRLATELQKQECPGVDFIPMQFRPAFSKHAGEVCGGIYIHVFDIRAMSPVNLGPRVLQAFKRTAPDVFAWRSEAYEFVSDIPAIDLLWGSAALRQRIDADKDVGPLLQAASKAAKAWRIERDSA